MGLRLLGTIALALLFSPFTLNAETRFVRGGSDGLTTWAVVSRNGLEYRTDQVGARINAILWADMAQADRRALITAYGWNIGRRIDDFGQTTSDEMASWIDEEMGWADAVEALKTRHANKAYPTLVPLFGPDATLESPDYQCVNIEVRKSADYKEAERLAREISYDYELGRQLYNLLVNAKWDQVTIAVKSMSEELIEVIVDNLMVGVITSPASKVSELVAQVFDPVKQKIRDILLGRVTLGAPPPTAIELIEQLDLVINDMETAAEQAGFNVQTKLSRLQSLAASLKQADADRTQAKRDDAAAVRNALFVRATTIPPPTIPPDFEPRNPEATEEEQQADVAAQAEAYLNDYVRVPLIGIGPVKDAAVLAVRTQYWDIVEVGPGIAGADVYLAEVSDGFVTPYIEVMDPLPEVEAMVAWLPQMRADMEATRARLVGATDDVNAVLDELLPQIDVLEARNLGMDVYADVLGYVPSEAAAGAFGGIRAFAPLIEIAATEDLTVDDLMLTYDDHAAITEEVENVFPVGISKRRQWITSEAQRYQNLRFNWENSISFVIARSRQIDRLHAGPYFRSDAYPPTCYSGVCIYKYTVDVAAIKTAIAAAGDNEDRERARVAALAELHRLRNEESLLLQKLEIAQRSFTHDQAELARFFTALYHRYTNPSDSYVEFAAAGCQLKTEGMLYSDLVPDITYYSAGGSWIRNRSLLSSNLDEAIGLVTGKIPEYYELLDLYHSMRYDRSTYLSMSSSEFNAFMTDTTAKIGYAGTYQSAFEAAQVWGTEWPAWQLTMKTQRQREELLNEYWGFPPLEPIAWDIEGTVTTPGEAAPGSTFGGVRADAAASGVGVPGVDVLLDGYLTESAKTDSHGRFQFTWVGSGGFTVTASGDGYQFAQPMNIVTMITSDITTDFEATETPESGYFVVGRVSDGTATGIDGVSLWLTSDAGEQLQVTSEGGRFLFTDVPEGEVLVRPVSDVLIFTPSSRLVSLNGSVSGIDFLGTPGVSDETSLLVMVAGNGSGSVESTPAGIDCPSDCWASYDEGTLVSLTATPGPDSEFAGWFGRCSGTGPCSVTMDDVRSVSARFDSTAPADMVSPTITIFSLPATSTSLVVPLTFAAIDDVAVTGYLVTTDTAQPLPSDVRWVSAPPTAAIFSRYGVSTLYGWARDAAGNLAAANPASVEITLGQFSGQAPASVVATSTTSTSVAISWTPVTGATSYVVERMAPGGAYQVLATVGSCWFTDLGASSGMAYLYRVKAGANGTFSPSSLPDLASTVLFADSPLTAGTPVRAVHISQLRAAVGATRQLASLGPYAFTDSATVGTPMRALHVTELRTALDQARGALGMPTGGHTDPSLAGRVVKAIHFQELRDRLQ